MPIPDDIMDHEVLGRERKRGIALGREEGRQEGREAGRAEGERSLILGLLTKRFGAVPEWAKHRLDSLSAAERERVGLQVLDAGSIEDIFA